MPLSDRDYEDALAMLAARQEAYATYRNYFDGKQPLAFATDQWDTAFGGLFRKLVYNRCKSVVDAYADRLAITGWETPDITEGQDDALGTAAMAIWNRNRMPRRQGELWSESLRAGDAYVIVWPDENGEARFAINRGHLIQPVYDDEYPDRMLYAVKCWQIVRGVDKGRWRVNVYAPDVITRWITAGKSDRYPKKFNGLTPFTDDEQPEIKNEFGRVPVFHFANNADTGMCGVSELADVIPLQDGVNKSVADMLVAGEFVSFPQRWAIGVGTVRNPFTNQEEEQFKAGVDRVWAVEEPTARFGQFDPAGMDQYVAAQDAWDVKIARVSRVPIHWLSLAGDQAFPSGEALKTAEGPFISKGGDRQIANGGTASDMMAFSLELEGAAPAGTVVSPIWRSFATQSDRETWEIAYLKIQAGVPPQQVWREGGYTDAEVAEFMTMTAEAQQASADALNRTFNNGGNPAGGIGA